MATGAGQDLLNGKGDVGLQHCRETEQIPDHLSDFYIWMQGLMLF